MRLRNALIPVAAIGLTFASPGCAEQDTTEVARVAGFDHTRDVEYEEQKWELVEDAEKKPWPDDEDIRNVTPHTKQDGCHEVRDSYGSEDWYGVYSGEEDDWDCAFDFSWNACSTDSEDDTHCEPKYKKVWNYEERVWRSIGSCAVEPNNHEMKAEKPRMDLDCIKVFEALPTNGPKRSVNSDKFWIRAEIKDPEKGTTRYLMLDVPPEQWAGLRASECVEVKGPKNKQEIRSFVGVCK